MFKNMKLVTRLVLGFSVPLLAIIVIALDAYGVTGWIKENVKLAQIENTESFEFAIIAHEMKFDVVEVQQFLTDISATRGQDGLSSGYDEAEKSRQGFLAGLAKFRDMYRRKNDLESLKAMDQLEQAFAVYYEAGKTMAKAYVEGGPAEGNKLMGSFDKTAEVLSEAMEKFIKGQKLQGQSALASISSYVDMLLRNILIAAMLTFALSAIVAWWSTRSICKPLNRIILGLNEGADKVARASGQVSSTSQSLAEGSSEQAASIEEISASLEELSAMTKQNADNSSQADNLVRRTNQVMDRANGSMGELIVSMNEISRTNEETSKIIKTIDAIAFQTNLLALNAAVEAARAGEAGAGFAVVADEVRNLAKRAAEAAGSTAGLIEGTVVRVKNGAERVAGTNEAFSEMVMSAGKVGKLVGEITAASNEQFLGIDQVNKAVTEMDKVAQQSAANAEELAAASEEMFAQVKHIRGMLNDLATLVRGNSKNGHRPEQIGDH